MKVKKVYSDNLLKIISIVLVLSVLLPILYTCVRCNFMSDDFYDVCDFRKFDGSIVVAAFSYTKYIYQTWLGTYFAKFLVPFSPLNIGDVQGLRVMMTFCTLAFVVIFFYFIKSIVYYLGWEKNVIYMLSGLILFTLFFCNAYPEVFYWFSGAVAYLLPIEMGLAGIALMVYAEEKKRKLPLMISCISVFFMSGGALQGAGLGCYLIFLLFVHYIADKKRISGYYGWVLGTAVFGALINTLAPGNYMRHAEVDDTGLHFISMFINSIRIVIKQIADFCLNPFYVFFLFGVFLIGVKYVPVFSHGILRFLVTIISFLAIPVVCAYPVVLAYNASGIEYFANRNHFLLDLSILLSLCGIMLLVGMQMQKSHFFHSGIILVILLGIFFYTLFSCNYSIIHDQAGFYMWKNVLNGKIKEHYALVEDMYEKIENSTYEDIVISQSELTLVPRGCYYDAVVVDPESWTNKAIAEFYGKKTIRLSEE